jgi:predicted enzyme related to lactoylglutathione lyase
MGHSVRGMADDVDRYLAGVPCWIDLAQPDVAAAVAFYGALFGWEVDETDAGLVARRDGAEVASFEAGDAGWTTSIRVDDADAAAAAVRAGGGRVLAAPADVGTAGRVATVADPSGAVFRLWQAGRRRGAQAVNGAGTWNWSNLVTDDVDRAAEFYGGLFGWQRLAFGPTAMWVLPGYLAVLERFDPALRERHADEGVPAGFSECVGWVLPGERPHWAVTFAVADTDQTVEQAVALGATVTVAPYTSGPVRAAELVDPQGAPFGINTYQP